MHTLNDQGLHIASRIAAAGQYVCFEMVLSNLLSWHGVPSFEYLSIEFREGGAIMSPLDVPVLQHLWRLERRLHTYTVAYMGGRSLVTYCNFEADVATMLRTYLVPSLGVAAKPTLLPLASCLAVVKNPEEIDIDDIDEDAGGSAATHDAESQKSFEHEFGVGSLRWHPTVQSYFGAPSAARPGAGIAEASILEHLLDFLSSGSGEERGHAAAASGGVPIDAFTQYVCDAEQVQSLAEIGVLLLPPPPSGSRDETAIAAGGMHCLHAETQMLRHVVQARARRRAEVVATMLSRASSLQVTEGEVSADAAGVDSNSDRCSTAKSKKRRRRNKDERTRNQLPQLRRPARSAVASFLGACEAALSDSSYSPTFAKMQRVVSAAISGQCGKTAVVKKRMAKMADIDGSDGGLLDVAVEYAMLHFGGERYRTRAFDSLLGVSTEKPDSEDQSADNDGDSNDDSSDDSEEHSRNGDSDSIDSKAEIAVPKAASEAPARITGIGSLSSSFSSLESSQLVSHLAPEQPGETVDEATAHCWDITIRPPPEVLEDISLSARSVQVRLEIDRHRRDAAPGSGGGGGVDGDDVASQWSRLPWGLPALDRSNGRAVGRWGESFVYQLLLQRFPPETGALVQWVNEAEETRAAYDIRVTFNEPAVAASTARGLGGKANARLRHPRRQETVFVEVKTTASDHLNTFDMSLQEWDFATRSVASSLVNYHVYRVFSAGNPSRVRVKVVEDILGAIEAKRARLCLAV